MVIAGFTIMVIAVVRIVDNRFSYLGSGPCQGHCIVFLSNIKFFTVFFSGGTLIYGLYR